MHDNAPPRTTVPLLSHVLAMRGGTLPARPVRSAFALVLALVALGVQSAIATAAPDGNPRSDPDEPTGLAQSFDTLDLRGERPSDEEFDNLAAAARGEQVQVIVSLRTAFTPEGALDEDEQKSQQSEIAAKGARLVDGLAGTDHEVVRTYDALPYVTLRLSSDALAKLEASGLAASLQEDKLEEPLLDRTAEIVEAREAASLGRTGAGRRIAVIDTGVDKDHAFIGSANTSQEACFSAGNTTRDEAEHVAH